MDYSRYRFRAEVDWIEIEIQTTRRTNFSTIRRHGGIDHVRAYDDATGKPFPMGRENTATTLFTFRIQDPSDWQAVNCTLDAITSDSTLSRLPTVAAIEVALDGYSLANSREELAELAAHFYKFGTYRVSKNCRLFRAKGDIVQPVPLQNATLVRYLADGWNIGVGNKTDDRYQHGYFKITDQSGPLSVPEHRARSEATLRGAALPCKTLDQWSRFRFETLQKLDDDDIRFFHFCRLKSGLDPFTQTAAEMSDFIGERKRRRRVNRDRSGYSGSKLYRGSVCADEPLNARAYDALRGLSRRWGRRQVAKFEEDAPLTRCGNPGADGGVSR